MEQADDEASRLRQYHKNRKRSYIARNDNCRHLFAKTSLFADKMRTKETHATHPTQAHIDAYHQNGFCILESRLSHDQLERCATTAKTR